MLKSSYLRSLKDKKLCRRLTGQILFVAFFAAVLGAMVTMNVTGYPTEPSVLGNIIAYLCILTFTSVVIIEAIRTLKEIRRRLLQQGDEPLSETVVRPSIPVTLCNCLAWMAFRGLFVFAIAYICVDYSANMTLAKLSIFAAVASVIVSLRDLIHLRRTIERS